MGYDYRVKRANDIPDDNRPADVVIADLVKHRNSLQELIASLRTENALLQRENKELVKAIHQLEREHLCHPALSPGEPGNQLAHTGKSIW